MTRHGKNATASAVYSYSERRKDARESGYGTLHARLGADSMKPFDCCSLTLQPCREPLISPDGFIFDREAILNYILDQKEAHKRQLKLWEQQCQATQDKEEAGRKQQQEELKAKFLSIETTPAHLKVPQTPTPSYYTSGTKRRYDDAASERSLQVAVAGPSSSKAAKASADEAEFDSVSNMAGKRAKEWKSFWVPELSTTAEPTRIEKPTQKILCPMSGKTLRFKDLLPVHFTPIDAEDAGGEHSRLVGKKERYLCPVSRDVLTDGCRCAYLKSSHSVVCLACVEKIIRKDMTDPLSGKPITEDDIIELQRGGTGFAATNEVQAKIVRPQLELQ